MTNDFLRPRDLGYRSTPILTHVLFEIGVRWLDVSFSAGVGAGCRRREVMFTLLLQSTNGRAASRGIPPTTEVTAFGLQHKLHPRSGSPTVYWYCCCITLRVKNASPHTPVGGMIIMGRKHISVGCLIEPSYWRVGCIWYCWRHNGAEGMHEADDIAQNHEDMCPRRNPLSGVSYRRGKESGARKVARSARGKTIRNT